MFSDDDLDPQASDDVVNAGTEEPKSDEGEETETPEM